WSRLDAKAMIPERLTVPYVGRSPTIPHSAAGCLIEPPVSEPSAHGASPPATAAAEPPEEPPGTRVGSHGLCDGPHAEFSVDEPIANSSMFVLPSTGSPAALQRAATVESATGMKPERIFDAAVVSTPFVEIRSFSAIGTPSPSGSST